MDWEIISWWFEYLSQACFVAMTKDGTKEKAIKSHFSRKRAKARGRKWKIDWDTEGRDKKNRITLSNITKIEENDLALMDTPFDTATRQNKGGIIYEDKGFDSNSIVEKTPLTIRQVAVNHHTNKLSNPTKIATKKGPINSDWRLRGCAPMTSKSSPFANIS